MSSPAADSQRKGKQKRKPHGTRSKFGNLLSLRSIFRFTRKLHLFFLIPAFLSAIATAIIAPVTSILVGKLMNSLSSFATHSIDGGTLVQETRIPIFGLVALGITTCLLRGAFLSAWMGYGESLAKTLREELFLDLVDKDFAWFEAQESGVSTLLNRIQIQIRELQLAVSQPLGTVIMIFFQTACSLGVAFYYSWKLTLVLLVTFPFIVLGLSLLSRGLQDASESQQQELTTATKLVYHVISNLTILKCYGGLQMEVNRYRQSLQAIWQFYHDQASIVAKQVAFMRVSGSLLVVIALFYGTYLTHQPQTTSGDILTTFWCCLAASKGFNEVIVQMLVLEKGRAGAVTLASLMRRVKAGHTSNLQHVGGVPRTLHGQIEFKNVSFKYPSDSDRYALRNVFLSFPAHEITYIVGQSGSGKSTIGSLLLRFYPPSCGQVTLDGMDMSRMDTNWLRNNVTLVHQDSVLFHDTIARNIAVGRPRPEQLEEQLLQDSIEFALLEKTTRSLPHGINTMVGRGGCDLSGGQKQRIALARARVRDTPVLILDEPTSALDPATKASIMLNIRMWRRNKTTIIITHDYSHLCPNDFVYVLRDGMVMANGARFDMATVLRQMYDNDHLETARTSVVGEVFERIAEGVVLLEDQPRIAHRQSDGSASSMESDMGDGTLQDDVALLGSVGDRAVNKESRRRTSQAILKQNHRRLGPRSCVGPMAPDHIVNQAILEEQNWIANDNRSGVVRVRQTMTQLVRPYSAYLSLLTPPTSTDREAPGASTSVCKNESGDDDVKEPELTISVNDKTIGTQLKDLVSLHGVLRTIWPSFEPRERYRSSFALFCCVAYGAVPAASSWIMVRVFQTFNQADRWAEDAAKWSLILFAVACGEAATAFSVHFLFETLAQTWINALRLKAFMRLLDQRKSWFDFEYQSLTQLSTTIDSAAEEMRNILGRFVPFMIIANVMIIISVICCLLTCWKLTLVGIAFAPVVYTISKVFESTSKIWESRTAGAASTIADILAESFFDVRTMRALTLESYFHKKHMTSTLQAFTTGLKRSAWIGLCFGVSEGAIPLTIAGVFGYAIVLAHDQEFPLEDILIVLSLLISTMISASGILAFVPQISSSIESGSRLLQLVNLSPQSDERGGQTKLDARCSNHAIELCNISFSYPYRPQTPVLKNVNLKFQAGQCTVLVGTSGSGKSTTVSLILGLYAPDGTSSNGGSLKISGHDIRELELKGYRTDLAYVPQHPVLFAMSIRDNILYGTERDSATSEERLHHAARSAGIHNFVSSLPELYDTIVGDGGLIVSGGQAQRIVIARALARQPKILLMDEPTSALDPESAEVIRNSIAGYKEKVATESPTIIVVTHCPEMMKLSDKIVVLRAGRIVEEGNFEELMHGRGELFGFMGGTERS